MQHYDRPAVKKRYNNRSKSLHKQSSNFVFFGALEYFVGFFELLDEEISGFHLQPARVVGLIKGILDGNCALAVHLPIDAHIHSDDPCSFVLLPMLLRVVFHEAQKDLEVVDPFLNAGFLGIILEGVVNLELLGLGLLHPLEVEVGLVCCHSVVHDRLSSPGLDQVVDQHQDHRVGGESILTDQVLGLTP